MKARRLSLWLSLSLVALAPGAGGTGGRPAAPQPPEVEVAQPVAREVADYEEAVGVVEPSVTVQVKARVSGSLDKVLFKNGAEVKKGDVLFEIDPKPLQGRPRVVAARQGRCGSTRCSSGSRRRPGGGG